VRLRSGSGPRSRSSQPAPQLPSRQTAPGANHQPVAASQRPPGGRANHRRALARRRRSRLSRSRIKNWKAATRSPRSISRFRALLSNPGSARVRGDSTKVHAASDVFHDEQDIQPLTQHRLDAEKVGGKNAVCLCGQELSPGGAIAARYGVDASLCCAGCTATPAPAELSQWPPAPVPTTQYPAATAGSVNPATKSRRWTPRPDLDGLLCGDAVPVSRSHHLISTRTFWCPRATTRRECSRPAAVRCCAARRAGVHG
jgi:hypothetical protein